MDDKLVAECLRQAPSVPEWKLGMYYIEHVSYLTARIAELEGALKPFAEVAKCREFQKPYADGKFPVNLGIMNGNIAQSMIRNQLTVADFRAIDVEAAAREISNEA